jgi:squalene-hopene/tetraprenyl-beta-curcumene cyclase
VLGLLAAGEEQDPAARRGVEFLLDRQAPDGSWSEDDWTGTGFPRVFYLKYHLYPIYFPLFALGVYAREAARPAREMARETRCASERRSAPETSTGGPPS